ncbi:hypothetical protein TKK_0003495 [Trichogramma kaykai]|uniref:Integrator complex subunit 10 n=1 Tax=Trichogramma kaykai TaxID=54128 RepID=A0ABD2XPM4_9HYME
MDVQASKEEYLLKKANDALAVDIHSAKSWLISAKSLFPHSIKVQFEAYRFEKLSKNTQGAAECFTEIFQSFPDNIEIWKETEKITKSLRSEKIEDESEFLCEMFQFIPQELQHRLLLLTAERSEETIEHCKLLLLLFKRFPQTISSYGHQLVETLTTAEKHNHEMHGVPVNEIRKLLTCEVLPLLSNAQIELPAKTSQRLLTKAVEFYLAYLQQPQDTQIDNPWDKLFQVLELMGNKLGWELSKLFAVPWNRLMYCDHLHQYANANASNLNDEHSNKQLILCCMVVFIRTLQEHSSSFGSQNYVLVEAFAEEPLSIPSEPKIKKRKKEEQHNIVITCDGEYDGDALILAVKLYDLMNASEVSQKEFVRLIAQLRLNAVLTSFVNDVSLYKNLHRDLLLRLPQEANNISIHLRMASSCFVVKDYKAMLEYIKPVVDALPSVEGKLSSKLTVIGSRHLHYLSLTKIPILQYCCKLLLFAIKESLSWPGRNHDWAIGHAFVLMQMDWPQEAPLFHYFTKEILNQRSFHYPAFQAYLINVDILEELTYLWTEHGGNVHLNISGSTESVPNRRIGTRGADKGVRNEIKEIMRKQVARDELEPIDEVLKRFIINEKTTLQHMLKLR